MRVRDPEHPAALDTRVVLRAQAGDLDGFDAIYRAHGPALHRHLRHTLGDADLAQDVLQDVFVLVYRKLRWLREPASLRPWLYRLATRQALRTLRRRTGRREQQLADADWAAIRSHSMDDSLRRSLLADQARTAIAHLPALSRAVLSLHYLESLPLAEVAAVLDVPLGTAKSRLASGLERLRRVFDPLPRSER